MSLMDYLDCAGGGGGGKTHTTVGGTFPRQGIMSYMRMEKWG